jgi:hypothetical protein
MSLSNYRSYFDFVSNDGNLGFVIEKDYIEASNNSVLIYEASDPDWIVEVHYLGDPATTYIIDALEADTTATWVAKQTPEAFLSQDLAEPRPFMTDAGDQNDNTWQAQGAGLDPSLGLVKFDLDIPNNDYIAFSTARNADIVDATMYLEASTYFEVLQDNVAASKSAFSNMIDYIYPLAPSNGSIDQVAEFSALNLGQHAFQESGIFSDARDNNTVVSSPNYITMQNEDTTIVYANQAFLLNEQSGGYDYTYEFEYTDSIYTSNYSTVMAPSEATLIGEFRGVDNSANGDFSLDVDINISMNSVYGYTTSASNLGSISNENIDTNAKTYVDFSGSITGDNGVVTIKEGAAGSSQQPISSSMPTGLIEVTASIADASGEVLAVGLYNIDGNTATPVTLVNGNIYGPTSATSPITLTQADITVITGSVSSIIPIMGASFDPTGGSSPQQPVMPAGIIEVPVSIADASGNEILAAGFYNIDGTTATPVTLVNGNTYAPTSATVPTTLTTADITEITGSVDNFRPVNNATFDPTGGSSTPPATQDYWKNGHEGAHAVDGNEVILHFSDTSFTTEIFNINYVQLATTNTFPGGGDWAIWEDAGSHSAVRMKHDGSAYIVDTESLATNAGPIAITWKDEYDSGVLNLETGTILAPNGNTEKAADNMRAQFNADLVDGDFAAASPKVDSYYVDANSFDNTGVNFINTDVVQDVSVLDAGLGDDIIAGGVGGYTVNGGDGFDMYLAAPASLENIYDTDSKIIDQNGVIVDLSASRVTYLDASTNDIVENIEYFMGTTGDDKFVGASRYDSQYQIQAFNGSGGSDEIFGAETTVNPNTNEVIDIKTTADYSSMQGGQGAVFILDGSSVMSGVDANGNLLYSDIKVAADTNWNGWLPYNEGTLGESQTISTVSTYDAQKDGASVILDTFGDVDIAFNVDHYIGSDEADVFFGSNENDTFDAASGTGNYMSGGDGVDELIVNDLDEGEDDDLNLSSMEVGRAYSHQNYTDVDVSNSGETVDDGGGLTLSSMVKEIQGLKDKFKREDADSRAVLLDLHDRTALNPLAASPFADLEKATVLQECRVFSDSKVVTDSPRKCSQLITKLLHIVTQGDAMSSSEVTEVFFGVTKLFQSSDASLRRMVYFFIKEVMPAWVACVGH